ncbi:hypothetical protein BGZ98_006300 [Dissophora globulifera]|nr:hypothetical protein BGZ98_006300 [Dissophora globulifera]
MPPPSLRQRKVMGASMFVAAAAAPTAAAAVATTGAASKFPPHHTLTSLSVTHVQFLQNDIVSKLMAYITLSPLGILCGYAAIIITSRDLKPTVMFAGQIVNEVVNQVLKRLVKQARPTEYLGDGYGMPSSHSQFMAYFAVYTMILMYRSTPDFLMPHIVSTAVFVWAALVVYSRVHLYYHTWQQVVAGTIAGAAFALIYYFVIQNILRPTGIFDKIVNHPWMKLLYVRDTDAIADVAKYDWEMWQQFQKSSRVKTE